MFGTDSCKRSDLSIIYPNVMFIRKLREEKLLSEVVIEKIAWRNCAQLLQLGPATEKFQ